MRIRTRTLIALFFLATAAQVRADSLGWNGLNRYLGLGWGDGYHVYSSQCRRGGDGEGCPSNQLQTPPAPLSQPNPSFPPPALQPVQSAPEPLLGYAPPRVRPLNDWDGTQSDGGVAPRVTRLPSTRPPVTRLPATNVAAPPTAGPYFVAPSATTLPSASRPFNRVAIP